MTVVYIVELLVAAMWGLGTLAAFLGLAVLSVSLLWSAYDVAMWGGTAAVIGGFVHVGALILYGIWRVTPSQPEH